MGVIGVRMFFQTSYARVPEMQNLRQVGRGEGDGGADGGQDDTDWEPRPNLAVPIGPGHGQAAPLAGCFAGCSNPHAAIRMDDGVARCIGLVDQVLGELIGCSCLC